MKPAMFYEKAEGSAISCLLCPHNCRIPAGKTGLCGARRAGKDGLFAESYGRVTSLALDPIEKKPLYRFHPGSMILSIGSYGCTFKCPFCQNHDIAMHEAEWRQMVPGDIAGLSAELAEKGNIGVAYTYNEPLAGYEFVRDCAGLVRGQGQKNVLVTNGFINDEPLRELLPLIDAMNVDVKGFSASFYRELGGGLEEVLRTVETAVGLCHVEVTALIVPGKNDSPDEMDALAKWLSGLDRDIPLHLSRFFPQYEMSGTPPTPRDTLESLACIAKKHLNYVYLGNVW